MKALGPAEVEDLSCRLSWWVRLRLPSRLNRRERGDTFGSRPRYGDSWFQCPLCPGSISHLHLKELSNTYVFMRTGESLLEEDDILSTNPLFLTNREAALSDLGQAQVVEACRYLKSEEIEITQGRYSLAASCADAADIVVDQLKLGRDRIVPEFTYLDGRGVGAWDFAAMNKTQEAVWALDVDEAGIAGRGGRPPENEDGTPAETLGEQVTRLQNCICLLETLYTGDTILLIFPDGTGPALLSCCIGGIPLSRVHEFNYDNGEIRYDVNYDSINALAAEPTPQYYLDIIQRGREELAELRENPDVLRNKKDLKFQDEQEKERLALEAVRLEDAKRNEEERIRKEQDRREMEAKRQLERKAVAESGGDDGGPVNPTTLGVVAFAAIAGGAGVAMSGSDGDGEQPLEESKGNFTDNKSTAEETDIAVQGSDLASDIPAAVSGFPRQLGEDGVTRDEVAGGVNGMSTNGDTPQSDTSEGDSENMIATGSGTAFNGEDDMADVTDEDTMASFEIEDYDEAWLGAITDILDTEVESDK